MVFPTAAQYSPCEIFGCVVCHIDEIQKRFLYHHLSLGLGCLHIPHQKSQLICFRYISCTVDDDGPEHSLAYFIQKVVARDPCNHSDLLLHESVAHIFDPVVRVQMNG